MSIRWRINALFLVMLAIAVAGGVGALIVIENLEETLAETDRRQALGVEAEELRTLLRDGYRDVTLSLSGDAEARQRYEAGKQRIESLLDSLEVGEAPGAGTLRDDVRGYFRAAEHSFFIAKRGDDERALRHLRRWILESLFPRIDAGVETLVSSTLEQLRASSERGHEAAALMALLLPIGLVVLLALVVVTFVLLNSWLVRPVGELVTSTRRISRGEIPDSREHRGDELGRLGAEIEEMARSLADSRRQLVEKERLAAVGEMTASVAHNVRNPLASIRALAQGILRGGQPSPESRESLQTIIETVDRASRWLKDLLVALRPVPVTRSPQDVNQVLREIAEAQREFASRRDVLIELDLAEELPPVPIDRSRIDQALISLVTNAVEASPTGESVALISQRNPEDPGQVEIVVADTGDGVDDELRKKIFVPYFTTKKNGTGLGLNLVQRIVHSHQGVISVDSTPGRGCRIKVNLPLETSLETKVDGPDPDSR